MNDKIFNLYNQFQILAYSNTRLKGEFDNFHQGSWRFVWTRGSEMTRSRACGSYLTPSNDVKGRDKGDRFIMFIKGWFP